MVQSHGPNGPLLLIVPGPDSGSQIQNWFKAEEKKEKDQYARSLNMFKILST